MVSWLGFKADISLLAVPLMLVGFLCSNSKKSQRRNIGELESLGDSGESISRILSRKNIHKKAFDQDTLKKLNEGDFQCIQCRRSHKQPQKQLEGS